MAVMNRPKTNQNAPFIIKACSRCGGHFGPENYVRVKGEFYADGYSPVCNSCIDTILRAAANDADKEAGITYPWAAVDKMCQTLDVPFVPAEFERILELAETNPFSMYAEVFQGADYEGLGWEDYNKEFARLKKAGTIEDELPIVKEEKRRKLKQKWGSNYDDEELYYLENLYNGLLLSQNVNGALQNDQALKLCKISAVIESKIREGADFDKMMGSYDKLVKIAEFTPKNAKNISDFDSVGELVKYLEKKGFKNKFYNDVTKDIVDETIKNIQSYNQRLYSNEPGIGDEVTRRIEALKSVEKMENIYDIGNNIDLDEFENDGYEGLFKDEDFVAEDL